MPKIVKNGKEYSGVPIEVVTAWQPTGDPVQVAEPLMGNTDISDIGDGTITGAVSSLSAGLMQSTKIIKGTMELVSSFSITLNRGIYLFFGGANDLKTLEVFSGGALSITNISGGNWTLSGSNFVLNGTAASSRWYFIVQLA